MPQWPPAPEDKGGVSGIVTELEQSKCKYCSYYQCYEVERPFHIQSRSLYLNDCSRYTRKRYALGSRNSQHPLFPHHQDHERRRTMLSKVFGAYTHGKDCNIIQTSAQKAPGSFLFDAVYLSDWILSSSREPLM